MGWLGGGAGAGHTAVFVAEAEAERASEAAAVVGTHEIADGLGHQLRKSRGGESVSKPGGRPHSLAKTLSSR